MQYKFNLYVFNTACKILAALPHLPSKMICRTWLYKYEQCSKQKCYRLGCITMQSKIWAALPHSPSKMICRTSSSHPISSRLIPHPPLILQTNYPLLLPLPGQLSQYIHFTPLALPCIYIKINSNSWTG